MSDRPSIGRHQFFEHREFFWRQMNWRTAHYDGAFVEIKAQIFRYQRTRMFLVGNAPKQRADTRKQFLNAERLDHVIIGARVKRPDLILLRASYREHDDGNFRTAANLPASLQSVQHRHI